MTKANANSTDSNKCVKLTACSANDLLIYLGADPDKVYTYKPPVTFKPKSTNKSKESS